MGGLDPYNRNSQAINYMQFQPGYGRGSSIVQSRLSRNPTQTFDTTGKTSVVRTSVIRTSQRASASPADPSQRVTRNNDAPAATEDGSSTPAPDAAADGTTAEGEEVKGKDSVRVSSAPIRVTRAPSTAQAQGVAPQRVSQNVIMPQRGSSFVQPSQIGLGVGIGRPQSQALVRGSTMRQAQPSFAGRPVSQQGLGQWGGGPQMTKTSLRSSSSDNSFNPNLRFPGASFFSASNEPSPVHRAEVSAVMDFGVGDLDDD